MKHSSVVRAAVALSVIGLLAGCSAGQQGRGAGGTTTARPAAATATYSAADLASIATKVNASLGLGGTVIDNAAAKSQVDKLGGANALTQQLGSSVTVQPAQCQQLLQDKLAKAPQAADNVTAMLTYGSNVLVVTAPGAKGWSQDVRAAMTSGSDDVLAQCGDMTLSASGFTVKLSMTKTDAKTNAEVTRGIHEGVTLEGAAQEVGSADILQALDGNLYIMVTESSSKLSSAPPSPATATQVANAALDAAKTITK